MIRNVTRYGIGVKGGRFQPMRIDYDARGVSTLTPLAPYLSKMSDAEAVLRPLGWVPYREQRPALCR